MEKASLGGAEKAKRIQYTRQKPTRYYGIGRKSRQKVDAVVPTGRLILVLGPGYLYYEVYETETIAV